MKYNIGSISLVIFLAFAIALYQDSQKMKEQIAEADYTCDVSSIFRFTGIVTGSEVT